MTNASALSPPDSEVDDRSDTAILGDIIIHILRNPNHFSRVVGPLVEAQQPIGRHSLGALFAEQGLLPTKPNLVESFLKNPASFQWTHKHVAVLARYLGLTLAQLLARLKAPEAAPVKAKPAIRAVSMPQVEVRAQFRPTLEHGVATFKTITECANFNPVRFGVVVVSLLEKNGQSKIDLFEALLQARVVGASKSNIYLLLAGKTKWNQDRIRETCRCLSISPASMYDLLEAWDSNPRETS